MPRRITPFINGEYYHLYNRGLAKQPIFNFSDDYKRFIETLFYYQIQNPKPKFSTFKKFNLYSVDSSKKIVEVICYSVMPNHFHLLIEQLKDGRITEFMRKFIHSYNKYLNIKYNRQGPVFQGVFKAIRVESDEQLIHLSRYIHLNPLASFLVKDLSLYPWSSYKSYINKNNDQRIFKDEILKFFKSVEDYQKFISDQVDYSQTLERIKHLAMEDI